MSDPRAIIIENGENVPTRLPIATQQQARRTRRKVLPKLLRVAGRIPFAEDVAAAYYAATDPQTPGSVRLILLTALSYFVLPVDLVPDVLAGLGFSDDAAVMAAVLGTVGANIKPPHRIAAQRLLGKPASPTQGE